MKFVFEHIIWFIIPLGLIVGYFFHRHHSQKQIILFKRLRLRKDGIIRSGHLFNPPAFEFTHEGVLFSLSTFVGNKHSPACTYLWVKNSVPPLLQCLIQPQSSRSFSQKIMHADREISLDTPEFSLNFSIQSTQPDLLKQRMTKTAIQALINQPAFYNLKIQKDQFYFSVIGFPHSTEQLEELITTGTLLYDALVTSKKPINPTDA